MTVQAAAAPTRPADDLMTRMKAVWAAQKARGHVPRTREEIDAEINAMRDEAEEEMQVIEQLQEERERQRNSATPNRESSR